MTTPARRIPSPLRRSPSRSPSPTGLSLLLLAFLGLAWTTNNSGGRRGGAALFAAAAPSSSTALFEALDADADGSISAQDWDASLSTIAAALGIDNADISNHVSGGELGARGRNEQAAAAQRPVHRDGLTGDNLVPRKAFNPASASRNSGAGADGTGGNGGKREKLSFTRAFTASVAMILATEIGDKTFFIAAVLSMRNDRAAVFAGAVLALVVMTVLSTMMGLVLPSILPRKYTHIIGGILFLYFGIKLILDSRSMQDKVSDELEEVEEELLHTGTKSKKDEDEGSSSDLDGGGDVDMVENGGGRGGGDAGAQESGRRRKPAKRSAGGGGLAGATAYQSTSFRATFVQSLTLTFLAEWGDRSQIATIALAAAKDPLGVTVGGCLGHSMCTGLAVVGGRMLAARISEKTVSFYGGIIFTIFGVHSLFFES